MEQRRPRLGDVVDDYCPRERRLANHVVVAMVGDDIRQTRCTTCDAEHVYKNARVPPKRKKAETPAALVKQVADGLADKPRLSLDTPAGMVEALPAPPAPVPAPAAATSPAEAAPVATPAPEPESPAPPDGRAAEDEPVHRPLIRATLPRLPGEERDARPIPEFTMRAVRNARGFRQGAGRSGGKDGNRPPRGRAAAGFRPGVMGSWSPSNPRPRGSTPPQGARPPQPPRPQGRKKPR
jgi:hypothetical protein